MMPPRANRHGSPCPPWCSVDHAKVIDEQRGSVTDTHYSDPAEPGAPWDVKVKLRQHSDGYRPECKPQVELIRICDIVLLDHPDAASLAGILEALADAGPARLRELAAEVRAAAVVAAGGS